MARTGPYDTQWLTQASFEPTAGRRLRRRALLWLAVLALAGLAAAGTGALDGPLGAPLHLVESRRQVVALTAEVERMRTELAMEKATRLELERHADELSARVTELTRQLEVLTSRNSRSRQVN